MKLKLSEATPAQINLLVAQCEQREGGQIDLNEPATNWAQGGPIIEREELTLSHSPYDHVFYGRTRPWCAEKNGRMEYGLTPLIAAMRCYCASKMGDEIEITEV
jgi:hypothetical protein